MTLEILIRCPELAELAQAIQGKNIPAAAPAPAAPAPAPAPVPVPVPVAPAAPAAAAPVPVAPAATTAPPPVVPVAPVAPPPTYDLNTMARAAADLIDRDPNKQEQLRGLLARFQVPTMAALPAERYGEFVAALKEMGAKL